MDTLIKLSTSEAAHVRQALRFYRDSLTHGEDLSPGLQPGTPEYNALTKAIEQIQ